MSERNTIKCLTISLSLQLVHIKIYWKSIPYLLVYSYFNYTSFDIKQVTGSNSLHHSYRQVTKALLSPNNKVWSIDSPLVLHIQHQPTIRISLLCSLSTIDIFSKAAIQTIYSSSMSTNI